MIRRGFILGRPRRIMPSYTVSGLLLLLASSASALRVMAPSTRPHHTIADCVRPRLASSCVRMEAAEPGVPAEATAETSDGGIAVEEADANGIQRGAFMAWYTREKAIEKFKEDNQQNPLEMLWSRFDGLIKTAAVLAAGWYVIPVVTALRKASENGDVVGELGKAITQNTY